MPQNKNTFEESVRRLSEDWGGYYLITLGHRWRDDKNLKKVLQKHTAIEEQGYTNGSTTWTWLVYSRLSLDDLEDELRRVVGEGWLKVEKQEEEMDHLGDEDDGVDEEDLQDLESEDGDDW